MVIEGVREVGAKRERNLVALAEFFRDDSVVIGIAPNRYVLELERKTSAKMVALYGHICDMSFKDGYSDLVSCERCVDPCLIEELAKNRDGGLPGCWTAHILAIEYAEEEAVNQYRAGDDLLWKRSLFRDC